MKLLFFVLLLITIVILLFRPGTQAFLESSPEAIVPYGHPSQSKDSN